MSFFKPSTQITSKYYELKVAIKRARESPYSTRESITYYNRIEAEADKDYTDYLRRNKRLNFWFVITLSTTILIGAAISFIYGALK